MGKFLKAVVVILLLVSVGAAVLAYMNFEKRKMLVGRTEKLESAIETLATTFNAADPATPDILPDFDARDITSVEAREVAVPDTSPFWEDYKVEYESLDVPKMNIKGVTVTDPKTGIPIPKIRQYYFLDSEGNRVQSYDGYQTTGSGTMAELLDQVQDRASAQSRLLLSVSAELKKVREELVTTIRELNEQKKLRRGDLVRIQNLEADKRRLEQEKSDLQATISRLEGDKARLADEKNSIKDELDHLKEDYETLTKRSAELEKRIKELTRGVIRPDGAGGGEQDQGAVAAGSGKSSPGVKGTVVYVDPNWPIVIVRLTPEAMDELTSADAEGNPFTRQEQYTVRRPGLNSPAGELITRIRIQSLRRDGSNLAIADNLTTWQQNPVQKGDEVFF